ncbi:hypothetical protein Tco_1295113 [Tanacetum coccineum]
MTNLTEMLSKFVNSNTASSLNSGSLPSNTFTNPKEDLKGITTRSGVAYKGPMIPTTSPKVVERETEVTKDSMPPTNNGSTKDVQPPVVPLPSCTNLLSRTCSNDPTSPEVDPTYYDPDGDILLLESILNSDPSPPPPNQGSYLLEFQKDLKICEANNEKSSVNEPPEEKAALIEVLKSHKRAIAWKLSDIKGIDPEFCTHKILMEDDYEPTVQHQDGSMGKPRAAVYRRRVDMTHRRENPHQDEIENKEITETFPLETLGSVALRVDSTSWFADFANYHAGNFIVKRMSSQQKNKFFKDVKHYFWDDPFLFKICADQVIRRCVHGKEDSRHTRKLSQWTPPWGHHDANLTCQKGLDVGSFGLQLQRCTRVVKNATLANDEGTFHKDEMPQNSI